MKVVLWGLVGWLVFLALVALPIAKAMKNHLDPPDREDPWAPSPPRAVRDPRELRSIRESQAFKDRQARRDL